MAENHEKGHEKGHATLATYAKIIIALVVITIAEIVVPYLVAHDVNDVLGIAALVVLAVLKYVLVVMFFMHLYYDQPLCTFLFVTGMILGGGTMAGLLASMPVTMVPRGEYGSSQSGAAANADPYHGPALTTADEKDGLKLFATNCVTCHALSTLDTATGVIGPSLDGIGEVSRQPGMTPAQYIDLSIKDPGAYVVEGYPNSMTNFGFSDTQRKQLVAFLIAQGKAAPEGSPSPAGSPKPAESPIPGSGVSPRPGEVPQPEGSPSPGQTGLPNPDAGGSTPDPVNQ